MIYSYKDLHELRANKVDLVFNKKAKDLTVDEKKARKMLKKLEKTTSTNEVRSLYSSLVRCAEKLETSHRFLNAVEQVIASKEVKF